MSTTLTAPETREFTKLEAIIESGLDGFVKVGNALAKIRDAGLYREQHATFDAYCRDRWKISRSRAYQLIASAEVVETLSTNGGHGMPDSERVARPLAKLPEAERAAAWQEAVDAEPDGPTAETVEAVVASRLQDEPEQADGPCPKGGEHEPKQDGDESFCAKCLEPLDSAPVQPKKPEPKSTIITRCEQFWSTLNETERIIAAGWFQDQLG